MDRLANRVAEPAAVVAAGLYFLASTLYYYANSLYFAENGFPFLVNFATYMDYDEYLKMFVIGQGYYPPFYYFFLFLIRSIFGLGYLPFYLSSALFVCGGGLYLYLFLRNTLGKGYAWMGWALYLLIPGTTVFSKQLAIELPLMLFIPAVAYHAQASRRFTRPGACLWLGIWTGLAMLTKWTFPVYVIGIFLYFFMDAAFDLRHRQRRPLRPVQWRNFGMFLGIALVISAPWYLFSFDLSNWLATAANDPNFETYNYLSQFRFSFTLLSVTTGKVWGPVALLIVALLALIAKNRGLLFAAALVLIVAPLALFSIPVHMEDRYLYPLTPAIAALVPAVISRVDRKVVKVLAAAVVMLVLCANHWTVYSPANKTVAQTKGSLFWGQARTREIIRYLDTHLADSPGRKPVIVATHPFWNNYHFKNDYLKYFSATLRSQLHHNFHVASFVQFAYMRFSKDMPQYDFLLLDPVAYRKFFGEGASQQKILLQKFRNGYVDQILGRSLGGFGPEELLNDYDRIQQIFRPLKTFDFPGGSLNILINRRHDAGAPPEGEAPSLSPGVGTTPDAQPETSSL